jgi:hypothetical protein
MKRLLAGLALALGLINGAVLAQESGRGVPLADSLLDKLTGDWNVERKMANGRVENNTVHGEWVLQHKFIELHYRDAASPPKYEAIVLIGYDGIAKHYLCHWTDNFGGDYSTDGFAPREEGSSAIEFKFTFHDGELTNRFAFNPETSGWTSTIRQTDKAGEWKLFCEDKFTKGKR